MVEVFHRAKLNGELYGALSWSYVGKAAWFAWAIVVLIIVAIGIVILAPESVLPSYSCPTKSVLDCASYGLAGIRGYFSQYLPRTIQSLVEFLVVAMVILFLATLTYGLSQSRKNELT
jgi:hypothetical protein